MLEGILGRLSQLGLVLRSPGRSMESARQVSNPGGTGWRLHAMLIDTILDLAGVDYDAVDRKLFVRPILPGQWPQTGIKQSFPCGDVSYRLERPIGGKVYHLNLKTQLKHPVDLEVELTCPDLKELGPWQASPPTPEPALDSRTGQLRFRITLPIGRQRMELDLGLTTATAQQGRRQGPSGGGSSTNFWYSDLASVAYLSEVTQQARSRARKTTPFSKSCPKSPYRRTSDSEKWQLRLARLHPNLSRRVIRLNHLDVIDAGSQPPAA